MIFLWNVQELSRGALTNTSTGTALQKNSPSQQSIHLGWTVIDKLGGRIKSGVQVTLSLLMDNYSWFTYFCFNYIRCKTWYHRIKDKKSPNSHHTSATARMALRFGYPSKCAIQAGVNLWCETQFSLSYMAYYWDRIILCVSMCKVRRQTPKLAKSVSTVQGLRRGRNF